MVSFFRGLEPFLFLADSAALCALEASEQELLTTDLELSPIYLRASQAERERLERLEKEKKGEVN